MGFCLGFEKDVGREQQKWLYRQQWLGESDITIISRQDLRDEMTKRCVE